MLRAGLDRSTASCSRSPAASHSGERYHLDGVRRILALGGLDETDLRNIPGYPLDADEQVAGGHAGAAPTSLAQNCSGKHAAMLADLRRQRLAARGTTSIPATRCSARSPRPSPTSPASPSRPSASTAAAPPCTPCRRSASPSRSAASPRPIRRTPEGRVADAVRTHPEWVGGTGRDVTRLIRGVPGLVAKDGAEGVYAAALPDGRAAALKIADGSDRPRHPVLAALLHRLGVEADVLDELSDVRRPRARRAGRAARGRGDWADGTVLSACASSSSVSPAPPSSSTVRSSGGSTAPGSSSSSASRTTTRPRRQADARSQGRRPADPARRAQRARGVGAPVLVVSQFTLYADTRKGRRPSWSAAAPGPVAQPLVDAFAAALRDRGLQVATGRFGADMAVELVNDGPVTLILDS